MGKKLTIEFVKKYVEDEGYECLSSEYINNNTNLELKCLKGHKFEATFNNFKNVGSRCPICSGWKKTIEEVKDYIRRHGYECLTNEYRDSFTRLRIKCLKKGHERETTLDTFQRSNRCWICIAEDRSLEIPESYCFIWNDEEFKEMVFERDRHKCMNSLCRYKWSSYRLCRHHIDYNRKNCDLSNIITLCISCNARANFNREWWTSFYQNLMGETYSYQLIGEQEIC